MKARIVEHLGQSAIILLLSSGRGWRPMIGPSSAWLHCKRRSSMRTIRRGDIGAMIHAVEANDASASKIAADRLATGARIPKSRTSSVVSITR